VEATKNTQNGGLGHQSLKFITLPKTIRWQKIIQKFRSNSAMIGSAYNTLARFGRAENPGCLIVNRANVTDVQKRHITPYKNLNKKWNTTRLLNYIPGVCISFFRFFGKKKHVIFKEN